MHKRAKRRARQDLSPLDEMLPPYFYAKILCFPLSPDRIEATTERLRESFSRLITETPRLAATIKREEGSRVRKGHLVLIVPKNAKGLLVFNDLTDPGSGWQSTYEQLRAENMPLRSLDAKFLAPLTAGFGQTNHVFGLQANFVQGGLLLTFYLHHNMFDGHGASQVIARLAEHYAGLDDVSLNKKFPASDRMPRVMHPSCLKRTYRYGDLKADPSLWRLNLLDWRDQPQDYVPLQRPEFIPSVPPPQNPAVLASISSISSEALQEIKRKAQPDDGASWVSTNDALMAFLWRHIMRARYPDYVDQKSLQNRTSSIGFPLDSRKILAISPGYLGNCIFHGHADLPMELSDRETPLSKIAGEIRQGVNRARDPQLLHRALGLAATIPDCRTLRSAYDNLGQDLYVSSWQNQSLYSTDWGSLGKAEFFRVPCGNMFSLIIILPTRDGDGIELITSLQKPHHERLWADEEFTKLVTLY